MKEALFNLLDENGDIWGQERWTWTEYGYKVEIRYLQNLSHRDFAEASKPNMSKKRDLVSQE